MPTLPSPEIIDVSRPLANGIAPWPGDTPYSFRLSATIAGGYSVNVGAINTGVHAATHCDAPFHYRDGTATIERLPLDTFIGECLVVDVRGESSWKSKLPDVVPPRVLFRTGGWPDTTRFPDAIPVMEADLPDWLADRGVRLIGVDVPSVDAIDSKTLDRHHALGRRDIIIVEGLWLEEVPTGRYELIAFPLRIVGGDGSPVRAVLKKPASGAA